MKPKTAARIFVIALVVIAVGIVALVLRPQERRLRTVSPRERRAAFQLLLGDLPEQSNDYVAYLDRNPVTEPPEDVALELLGDDVVMLAAGGAAAFTTTVPAPGSYSLYATYRRTDRGLTNTSLAVRINGTYPFNEARDLELRRRWSDETKEFSRDRYNDESLPLQLPNMDWIDAPFRDVSGRTVRPLLFRLESGPNRIEVENLSSHDLEISSLRLESPSTIPGYSDYRSTLSDLAAVLPADDLTIEVDAISYVEKNSYDVRMGSLNNPTVDPSDAVDRLLNVIDGPSWDASGEEIRYAITIPEDGNYTLTLHYQNPRSDLSSFRTIRIDGKIPFAEVAPYEFEATGSSLWRHETLSNNDGQPFRFYLPAGTHSLSLRAEKEPVAESIRALKTIIAHMNYFGIEIMKVAGRDIDEERTWRLTDYLENTARYLDAYHLLVSAMIEKLAAYTRGGVDSALVAPLVTALFKLEKLAEDPDELPLYLQDIYSTSIYDRPVTQILGDAVNFLDNCELSLDDLILEVTPRSRPDNANIFRRLAGGVEKLASTFTSDKYVTRDSDEELDVWVTRALTHIDLQQKLSDADFTQRTGVPVKVSVMPEPNRLILATAADRTPDLAMGLPSYIPFDLAIRGAIYDISGFDDFWSFASQFSPGAFVPYVLNERVYGMPETLDFHTLVYRKDIFAQLGITPPDTWQDVIELLPVLQRYGMNFYHPIAGGLPTLKWFYQTSPFVYQFGGRLYNPDGLSVSLDDSRTVQALTFLSELFTLYALQEQIPIFYNSFRFGVVPAGVVDSQSYLQMKYAAPELKGQWALAPYPGIPNESGEPQRWFIANGVAAVVMQDTPNPEVAWDYLKWWLAPETQVDFGYRLQSTYGPEYLWISANLDALADAPIDAQDKAVILEQVKWQRDVPRTPAHYMLERGLSDIWINSATQNKSVRTEIDTMIPVINREVTRKMIEFGFVDTDGNPLRPFVVPDIDWIRENFARFEGAANE